MVQCGLADKEMRRAGVTYVKEDCSKGERPLLFHSEKLQKIATPQNKTTPPPAISKREHNNAVGANIRRGTSPIKQTDKIKSRQGGGGARL